MIYLNNKDKDIIANALDAFYRHIDVLDDTEVAHIDELNKLLNESIEYSRIRRDKSKEIIQAKRKIDKTYAHTKNKKKTS